MSAIGGKLRYGGETAGTELMLEMSRAMMLRGRDQRGAYIKENGWLFHNRSSADGGAPWFRQPLTAKKEGASYTVVLDGRVRGRGEWKGLCEDITSESDAMLALDCYLAYGTSFLKYLDGSFALAIWDERQGEMILAVDQDGSRPLFYMRQGDEFLFASELKGLFCAMPCGVAVDRERLRHHLCSPVGGVRSGGLYREIGFLPAGHCLVVSRLGVSMFSYDTEKHENRERSREIHLLEWCCPSERELREMMNEILYSFDYPQFDHWMPALLHLVRGKREKTICFGDEMRYADIAYAMERADRLGQSRGKVLRSASVETEGARERELKRMDRLTARLLEGVDPAILDHLYSPDWRIWLEREKNTAKRIRMQGILYQSILWNERYSLILT